METVLQQFHVCKVHAKHYPVSHTHRKNRLDQTGHMLKVVKGHNVKWSQEETEPNCGRELALMCSRVCVV